MAYEIERKFLVNIPEVEELIKTQSIPYTQITQGYLNCKGATVRVRLEDNKGYLVIKGPKTGITCPEFDYEIPREDVLAINKLTSGATINKYRYRIDHKGFTWEVDVFNGVNAGLVVAEIELNSEDQDFPLPYWVIKEVSDDIRYSNYNLSIKPFIFWK